MLAAVESQLKLCSELEEKIDYKYKDKKNFLLATTHSSYANENRSEKLKSNERLEFLGDSVLSVIISEFIYNNYADLAEGEMTKARANIVCEASLVKCSNSINLGKYLLLGKGEENTGGRTRVSILSDAFEALIASIYLDGGLQHARKFVLSVMDGLIKDSIRGVLTLDYKTQLQEKIQKTGDIKIIYEIIDENGPDHNKKFVSQVRIGDKICGTGEGRSKKEAEQNAARVALDSKLPF